MNLIPSTVVDIKSARFPNRKSAFECLQLYHAKLNPPRKLKAINDNSGSRVSYCCVDQDCSVRVSIKRVVKHGQKRWIVFERKNMGEIWDHSEHCESVVALSSRTAAHSLCNVDATSNRDLIHKAREYGINLGGNQSNSCDIDGKAFKAASRLQYHISNIKNEMMDEQISKLPAILELFKLENTGSHAAVYVEDNLLKRCLIVSQLSIAMYKYGYLRRLFAIDCGLWKVISGKQYKLLLIDSTTGNNENCCIAWAIVDGETTTNIIWVIEELRKVGIELNDKNVATISDEGKALLKAINTELPLSFHLTCAKHWLGGHKGKWETTGKKDSLFWQMVTIALNPLL